MAETHIRRMTKGDLETVVQLYTAANPFANPSEIRAWTEPLLTKLPMYHFVYTAGNNIIGAISGKLTQSHIGIVNDVAVLDAERGKGIGYKLIMRLLSAFEKDGIYRQRLMVFWPNAAAVPLYYKCGFTLKKIDHVEKGDVIWMERTSTDGTINHDR